LNLPPFALHLIFMAFAFALLAALLLAAAALLLAKS